MEKKITMETNDILEEILKWIKFSGMKNVKEVLLASLTDDTKKIVYHYSDGTNSTEFIKKITNIRGNDVIPKLWNKWKNVGIMNKIQVKGGGGRGKKVFDLEDFGIAIPELKIEKSPEKVEGKEKEINGNKEVKDNKEGEQNTEEQKMEEKEDHGD